MAPRLYSLTDATQLISPEGRITARSLRTEARAGRLQPVRIAGKDFVTEESLAAMVAAATLQLRPPCPVADFQPASISVGPEATETLSGLSSTDRARLAQAQAQMSLQRLKQPSRPISRKTIGPRVVQIDPSSSSSRK
jgi:hypothetical protein